MRVVLSVAGFDPSGGAGTLADIKTFAALGCFGTAAITSLTFQNTLAVYGASHQTAQTLLAQIEPVLADFEVAALKIGMLPTPEIIETVADIIERNRIPNVILDPVIRSSSGFDLIDSEAVAAIIRRLFPLADLITPNMAEAERITDLRVTTLSEMQSAGEAMMKSGARAVLVKGGHLPDEATDLLVTSQRTLTYRAPRIETRNTHGTGCTLSSAIAAFLALGDELSDAILKAKQYLNEALLTAPDLGQGAGPLDHFTRFRSLVGKDVE